MTEMVVEIPRKKREFQRKLGLDKGFADALRDYAVRRWPAGTAKLAAREWDLSVDEGRALVAGKASKTTVEKCVKRAGLLVGILLLEEVTGERLADFYREKRSEHAEHAQRLAALVGDRGAMAAHGRADPADDDLHLADREDPVRRRMG